MRKTIFNNPGEGITPNQDSGNFELDEIKWDNTVPSFPPGLIPFKNITEKILEELEQ